MDIIRPIPLPSHFRKHHGKSRHCYKKTTTPERNHDWAYTNFCSAGTQLNKANAMMRAFNTGMFVFDGIVLG